CPGSRRGAGAARPVRPGPGHAGRTWRRPRAAGEPAPGGVAARGTGLARRPAAAGGGGCRRGAGTVAAWARPARAPPAPAAAAEAGMQAGEPQPEAIGPGADALAWRYLLAAVGAHLRQDHARAGPAYRNAVAHAERDGVPEEVAATIMAYAAWALERGALDE